MQVQARWVVWKKRRGSARYHIVSDVEDLHTLRDGCYLYIQVSPVDAEQPCAAFRLSISQLRIGRLHMCIWGYLLTERIWEYSPRELNMLFTRYSRYRYQFHILSLNLHATARDIRKFHSPTLVHMYVYERIGELNSRPGYIDRRCYVPEVARGHIYVFAP